jgi:hypothetical protein
VTIHESLLFSNGISYAFGQIGFGLVIEKVGQVDNSKEEVGDLSFQQLLHTTSLKQ